MKKIIKNIVLAAAFIFTLGATVIQPVQAAEKGIKISKKNFPDAAFRKGVKTNFDLNKDGYLSKLERLSVAEIGNEMFALNNGKRSESKTYPLKGIEYFSSLKRVNFS